jgi:adenine-specific DNA-methyltransferase
MKLKHAILETLSRDELKKICSDLDVTDVDQRSIEDMAAKLSRARRATPAVLLEYLSEAQVKDAAERAGAPTTGRRTVLIAALLAREDGAGESLELSGQVATPSEHAQAGKGNPKTVSGTGQTDQSPYTNEAMQKQSVGVQDEFQPKSSPGTYRSVGTDHTEQYRHANEAVQRPDVGVQDQFQAKKPPRTYRYDSSLDPALSWSEQRERDLGEWLLGLIERAAREGEKTTFAEGQEWQGGGVQVTSTADAVRVLRDISKPFLNWAGKAERHEIRVPTVPLFVHERHSTKAILDGIRHRKAKGLSLDLFGDPNLDIRDQLEAYEHKGPWQNRMILGDSLQVMNSMLEYEGLGSHVQMIYIDPPYGVKFGSNFQPFVRKREVKDGADTDITREPEMVKAYRDTWELGLHSYLTYMRDRLVLARELLNESGSIFVQISDENLHLVKQLLGEVFGSHNIVAVIPVVKTSGLGKSGLPVVCDYLVWAARNEAKLKYHQLFMPRGLADAGSEQYRWILTQDGMRRRMTATEAESSATLPDGAHAYRVDNLTSGAFRENTTIPYEFEGRVYHPGAARCWKTTKDGLDKLASAGRLQAVGNTLGFVRFIDDFAFQPLKALWTDTATGGFADEKLYVVQTTNKIIARCLLMTTDPGDLVFDPTCGSGTTAYVAEQWGRRWITCDTSRVPLALARQRLLTATFPYYQLRDVPLGPSGGFVYKQRQNRRGEEIGGLVPHITPKSFAKDEAPGIEVLVDRPEVLGAVTRVSGPFVVEATIAPVQALGQVGDDVGTNADPANHIERMTEVLRQSKTLQLPGNRELILLGIRRTVDAEYLHAEANEGDKRIAVVFGPPDGAVSSSLVYEAAREAHFLKYDQIYFFGFAIEPNARGMIEDSKKLRVQAVYVAVTPDVVMSDLLKTTRASEIFSITGLPDFEVKKVNKKGPEGQLLYEVDLRGLDIFDPESLATESVEGQNVPCWMLDSDYDGMSFYATQVFFPKTSAWDNLRKSLKTTFDDTVWGHLAGTTSEPFALGEKRRIAVKVIDERGNELLRIKDVGV